MSEFHPDGGHESDENADLESVLGELVVIVEKAKSVPLSSSAMISREEVLDLLELARSTLPAEIQKARRLLVDRDEVRARAEREAAELVDEARAQAAHMVQRTEVVRQAHHQAARILEDAESEARKILHEADDYVDRKLAAFEIVLDRTVRTVQAGRERLAVLPGLDEEQDEELGGAIGRGQLEEGFFDQDRS